MSSLGRFLKKPQTSDYQQLTVKHEHLTVYNVLLVSLVAQYVYIPICKLQIYIYIHYIVITSQNSLVHLEGTR